MWRQVAVLGLVLAVVASAVAVPLRSYLEQRQALAVAMAEQQALEERVAELNARKTALQDPNYVKAEARRRLQYVSPGETVYRIVVSGPADQSTDGAAANSAAENPPAPTPAAPAQPWYGQLWDTLSEDVSGG